MTPERVAMVHGLDIYRTEMRDYIRVTLQSAYGPDWFVRQVLPHVPSHQRRPLKWAYDEGENPALLLDVGHFRTVLSAHAEMFPASLQVGQFVESLDIILHIRNKFAHSHSHLDLNEAEQLFGSCRDVLERCGRLHAASMIRDLEAAYDSRALSRDKQADTTAEGKPARLLDRALPRDQQADTTAEDELARLLGQLRENLRNDLEESLAELIQDTILKGQGSRLTPDEGIANGLRIFQTDMRAYIRSELQRAYGADWCETQVAPLFPGGRDDKILKALRRGESPERQLDVGLFRRVIAEHGDLFPKAIREGEHHNRLDEIANFRNRTTGHDNEDVYRADTERLLGWCIDVLEQCGRLAQAKEIRAVASSIGWRQLGDGTDVE